MIAVAVLVVTCPCAAGLATPAVTARAADLLMREGIVLKSGAALERLGQVDHVFADKTGTLTTAQLELDASPNDVLRRAAGLAAASSHPLARALVAACPAVPAEDVLEIVGQGMSTPDGAKLGSAAFVGTNSTRDGPELWYRSADGSLTRFGFSETPRQGLQGFFDGLAARSIPLTLLSGDQQSSVQKFAELQRIADWRAEQQPEDKLAILQNSPGMALMLGDGINDTLALSVAPISASFAQATQIAQSASDIVLLQPRPDRLIIAIDLARKAQKLIRQNLGFATIYNLITVPLALVGWLSPLLAAILMSSSSIIVLGNGLRLKVQS